MRRLVLIFILALSLGPVHAQETASGSYIAALKRSCKADSVRWLASINVSIDLALRAQEHARLRREEALYTEAERMDRVAENHIKELAAEIFLVADTAKKLGCHTVADENYHKVINIFTGNNYAGYRQRAQIGLKSASRAR